jgi:hypothetical protein
MHAPRPSAAAAYLDPVVVSRCETTTDLFYIDDRTKVCGAGGVTTSFATVSFLTRLPVSRGAAS